MVNTDLSLVDELQEQIIWKNQTGKTARKIAEEYIARAKISGRTEALQKVQAYIQEVDAYIESLLDNE